MLFCCWLAHSISAEFYHFRISTFYNASHKFSYPTGHNKAWNLRFVRGIAYLPGRTELRLKNDCLFLMNILCFKWRNCMRVTIISSFKPWTANAYLRFGTFFSLAFNRFKATTLPKIISPPVQKRQVAGSPRKVMPTMAVKITSLDINTPPSHPLQ